MRDPDNDVLGAQRQAELHTSGVLTLPPGLVLGALGEFRTHPVSWAGSSPGRGGSGSAATASGEAWGAECGPCTVDKVPLQGAHLCFPTGSGHKEGQTHRDTCSALREPSRGKTQVMEAIWGGLRS